MRARRLAVRLRQEKGTGLIAAVAGVAVFLALLLVAAHLLVHLYARSVVTAAAFDAARIAAGAGDTGGAAAAEAHVRSILGSYGAQVQVQVATDADTVTVTVIGDSPGLNWPGMSALGSDAITRAATVRREQFIDAAP